MNIRQALKRYSLRNTPPLDHMQTLKLLCIVGYVLDADSKPDNRQVQEMNGFLHDMFNQVLEGSGMKDSFPEGSAVRSHGSDD